MNAYIAEQLSLPEAQLRRLERMRNERHFLLDVQSPLGTNLQQTQLSVSGSTGNVYTITIDAETSQMKCSCPDFDGNAAHDDVLCKHCCFVIYRVLRSSLKADFFNNNAERKFGREDIVVYQRRIAHLQRLSLNSATCQPFVSLTYRQRYQTLKRSLDANAATDASTAVAAAASVEDGTSFGLCLASKCKPTELEDACGICYEDLCDAKPADALVRCGECCKFLHQECAELWLKKNETCVYCRAWLPYSSFLQKPAEEIPRKRPRINVNAYLNVAANVGAEEEE